MISIIVGIFLLRTISGFTVEDSKLGSSFGSVLQHELNSEKGHLSKWGPQSSASVSNARLAEETKLLQDRTKSQFPSPSQNVEDLPLLVSKKAIERAISRQNVKISRDLNIELLDDSDFSSALWSKRQAPGGDGNATSPQSPDGSSTELQKIKQADDLLSTMQPNYNCLAKLYMCAFVPVASMDCVLECYLNTHVLANPNTKFLYRMLKVFVPYAQQLCPTFGTVYNRIQTEILKTVQHNTLNSFLEAVGINMQQDTTSVQEFRKNAPLSLFNNLVKHGYGDDFAIVKSILSIAESWWDIELDDMQTFPSLYSNPVCPKAPNQQWIAEIVDVMTRNPLSADIFLRGYYVVTRGLTQNLTYPIDTMFAATAFALKMLVGVDCSLVSYAQQGVPFVCLQPPPIEQILEDYSRTERENENPFKWFVCGAYQAEIPNWGQMKAEMAATSRDGGGAEEDQKNDDDSTMVDNLHKFPNPDEMYVYYDG